MAIARTLSLLMFCVFVTSCSTSVSSDKVAETKDKAKPAAKTSNVVYPKEIRLGWAEMAGFIQVVVDLEKNSYTFPPDKSYGKYIPKQVGALDPKISENLKQVVSSHNLRGFIPDRKWFHYDPSKLPFPVTTLKIKWKDAEKTFFVADPNDLTGASKADFARYEAMKDMVTLLRFLPQDNLKQVVTAPDVTEKEYEDSMRTLRKMFSEALPKGVLSMN